MPNRLLPLLGLGAGALAALGFAPLDLWPATLAGVALLFWVVMRSKGWFTAGLSGLAFGTGMFAVSLNWIAASFTYQSAMDPALGWVTVVGLSLFLALYVAVPAALAALAREPEARVLLLAALWLPAEWLRGTLLTGFAWNPLGIAWLAAPGLPQLAADVGGIGLTALMLAASAGLVWLVVGPAPLNRLVGGAMLVLVGVGGLVGDGRITQSGFLGAPVVIVQPGLDQAQRLADTELDAHLDTYLDLTRAALRRVEENEQAELPDVEIKEANIENAPEIDSPLRPSTEKVDGQMNNRLAAGLAAPPPDAVAGGQAPSARRGANTTTPTLVVWPEGAIDGLLERDAALRARAATALREGDVLITGGTGTNPKTPATPYANSLFVLDKSGRIRGRYDKAHLVPLGEYVPWRDVLEPLGIARLVPGDSDFSAGPGARTIVLPGRFLGMAPVICYEIAFPSAVVDNSERPAFITNISNDAWFGAWGPPQHLAQARLRAIEEGLPILRATTNGVSAVIDGHGRLVGRSLGHGAETVITTLPPPLPAPAFTQGGGSVAMLFGLLLLALALFLERDRFRRG